MHEPTQITRTEWPFLLHRVIVSRDASGKPFSLYFPSTWPLPADLWPCERVSIRLRAPLRCDTHQLGQLALCLFDMFMGKMFLKQACRFRCVNDKVVVKSEIKYPWGRKRRFWKVLSHWLSNFSIGSCENSLEAFHEEPFKWQNNIEQ
jgi:hypothetical protein